MGTRVPLLHITDLYHPPYDPDDQVDLATAYALPELDVRAILLDYHRNIPDMAMFEPGFLPVAQLNWLTGRAVPAAAGPGAPLAGPEDDGRRFKIQEQAAINLLLEKLAECREPAVVTVVGSCRILACALNRSPALVREKVRLVKLVAGVVHNPGKTRQEVNVRLDAPAFVRVLESGLPLDWYPCAAALPPGEADKHPECREHSCDWEISEEALHRGLDPRLHAWLIFGVAGNQRGDIIRALHEDWTRAGTWWAGLKHARRWLWSTAALVDAAGRALARTAEGWRFVPAEDAAGCAEREMLDLRPVNLRVDAQGYTEWEFAASSHSQIFCRRPERHALAMGEALNALLRGLGI